MDFSPRPDSSGDALSDAAVATSEALFASILDVAVDAIIVTSADQRILHFNHGASQIFGYAP